MSSAGIEKTSAIIQPARAGFTLVELLVVIGIIAVLIGILLPALSKAQARSRQVACMSNLHQIGIAIHMYSLDNRDHYPATEAVGGYWGYRRALGVRDVPVAYPEWMGLCAVLNGVRFNDYSLANSIPQVIAGVSAAAAHPLYLSGQSKAWICPAYPDKFIQWGNTYTYNILVQFTKYTMPSSDGSPPIPKRIGDLTGAQRGDPDPRMKQPVVLDNVEFLPYQSGAIAPSSVNLTAYSTPQVRPHPRRSSTGRTYNVLLFDSHVEVWPP